MGSLGISWYKLHSTCLFSRLNLVNQPLLRKYRHERVFHMQPLSGSFKKINAECPRSGQEETLWMSFSRGIGFLVDSSSQTPPGIPVMCGLDIEIHPYVTKTPTPGHLRLLRNFGCSSPLGKSVSPPIFGPFFSFSIPSRSHLKRPQVLQGFLGSLSREMARLPQGHLKNRLMPSCQW